MPSKSTSIKPLGIALIAFGLILFLFQMTGFDLFSGRSFWPLFIIIPGAILLAVASFEETLSIALAPVGMMITLTGCVLAYQNWADHYQSWAYAWIITGPFALGAGLAWHGRMHGDEGTLRRGHRIAALSLPFFLGAAVIFELVFNISGYGLSVDLPWGILISVALIAIGGGLFLKQPKQD
jgi:hypothetical protein